MHEIIQHTKFDGLDIIPANIDLSAAEVQLVTEVGREQILASVLRPIVNEYDAIFIDCQPSLGLLTVNPFWLHMAMTRAGPCCRKGSGTGKVSYSRPSKSVGIQLSLISPCTSLRRPHPRRTPDAHRAPANARTSTARSTRTPCAIHSPRT